MTEYKDYPCVIDREKCPNKQAHPVRFISCHGSTDPRCYVNWASTDPEDVEPYKVYLAEVTRG